jgi:hypothetical protein
MHTLNCLDQIRLWRVGGAIHANIRRSVIAEPPVIDHRPSAEPAVLERGQLLDLALNILNLFVPPELGAVGEKLPVKCYRGHCSAFAARHHAAFARAFLEPMPAAGGAIDSAEIVAWIERRRESAGQKVESVAA